MPSRRTISGTIAQKIPPEKLDKYAIWGEVKAIAQGRTLYVVYEDDSSVWDMWLPWRNSMSPVVVTADDTHEEGESVKFEVEPAPLLDSDEMFVEVAD